jgi:hypothetical protein
MNSYYGSLSSFNQSISVDEATTDFYILLLSYSFHSSNPLPDGLWGVTGHCLATTFIHSRGERVISSKTFLSI